MSANTNKTVSRRESINDKFKFDQPANLIITKNNSSAYKKRVTFPQNCVENISSDEDECPFETVSTRPSDLELQKVVELKSQA